MFIRKYFRLTAKLKAFLEVLYFHSPFDCAQTFFAGQRFSNLQGVGK